jgi:hypothetical protein
MLFNPSPTELTTAATDAVMGVLCAVLVVGLTRLHVTSTWKRAVWSWLFGLLIVASALGAIVHGLNLPTRMRAVLWLPLYLSLGLSIALFLVGAVADWRGDRAAQRLLPWAMGIGVAFFAASQLLGGAFLVFVVYEAVAMFLALGIYVSLALAGRRPGAWTVSAGIALTLVAAALQASPVQLRLLVPFDHNGLFHNVQAVATVIVARGVRIGLVAEV